MIKTIFSFLILLLNISYATATKVESEPLTNSQEIIALLSLNHWNHINSTLLPKPYDYLLTQPLMTKGIKTYYQRTPIIHPIYAKKDKLNNIYSRVILMLIDANQDRNNPELAQKNGETLVVELALIHINFNELSKKIIADILHTQTPFGKLLLDNNIKISTKDRSYFSVNCNQALSALTHCEINSKLYGRTNTIVRKDNKDGLQRLLRFYRSAQSSLDAAKRNQGSLYLLNLCKASIFQPHIPGYPPFYDMLYTIPTEA